jgi:signal transduction histidine kinase
LSNKEGKKFISITVSDTGVGINPDIIGNMFERGTSETGSGLGLAICKTAIETYGGTITAQSEEGKGTQMIFTLPAYDGSTNIAEERVPYE